MFYLWRRMGEEDRGCLWRLYGWFSGLMTCGSCFGAVSWAARMMFLVNDFKAHDSTDQFQHTSLSAIALSWMPPYLLMYAVEFLCMCAAQLMVLDRMMVFAAPEDAGMQKRWALAGRVVMAAVVLGNAVGWRPTLQLPYTFKRLLRLTGQHLCTTLPITPKTVTNSIY